MFVALEHFCFLMFSCFVTWLIFWGGMGVVGGGFGNDFWQGFNFFVVGFNFFCGRLVGFLWSACGHFVGTLCPPPCGPPLWSVPEIRLISPK